MKIWVLVLTDESEQPMLVIDVPIHAEHDPINGVLSAVGQQLDRLRLRQGDVDDPPALGIQGEVEGDPQHRT